MVIVGTGGHASDLLSDGSIFSSYDPLYFFDSINKFNPLLAFGKYKVFNEIHLLKELPSTDRRFILAVGKPSTRELLYWMLLDTGLLPVTFSSATSLTAPTAQVGVGSNVMPFAAILGNAILGKGSLVNSHVSIHHDVVTGDFCEISPGCRVLGGVTLEERVHIGSNTTVLPGVRIGSNTVVGAGSVVTKDLPSNCTAVGVPAKIIRK